MNCLVCFGIIVKDINLTFDIIDRKFGSRDKSIHAGTTCELFVTRKSYSQDALALFEIISHIKYFWFFLRSRN